MGDDRLARCGDTAGVLCVCLNVECGGKGGRALCHELNGILVLSRSHRVCTEVKNVILIRIETDHTRQSNVCQQSQRSSVCPIGNRLVDRSVFGITDLYENNYTRDFSILSYFAVNYSDGSTAFVKTQYDGQAHKFNIHDLAVEALKNESSFTSEELEVIRHFAK